MSRKRDVVNQLQETTSAPDFWQDPQKAKKVMRQLDAAKGDIELWNTLVKKMEDISAHLELAIEANDASEEKDVANQLQTLETHISELEVRALLGDEHDMSNAILTIHSGAGGTEAADWTNMLLRMYMRYTERKGFKFSITDILPGDEAGIKRVTAIVSGAFSYGLLKAEMGVHRLVRISPFDSNKRRHTSFASCDVIPEIDEEINIEVNESDLRIDTFRSSGAGGQHVNKTDSAVRITHNPTGIVVACQQERSQIKNRAVAMKILKAKLYELEQEKKRAALEKHYDERGDIAWGSQIRSYVFMPYQLVKDLRTNHETGNVGAVLDGDLDPFIRAFLDWKTTKKDANIAKS
ncbi:peptide chain release factor 2 [bacterium F11]|nr:peptide chain release factor 2 [bacterium F11]